MDAIITDASCDAAPGAADRGADVALDNRLADIAALAETRLAPMAARIDEGHYPLDMMAPLARAGAFGFHLSAQGARYDLALAAMETISAACGSTGFLTWSHDVMGLYLDQSGNNALKARLLPGHVAGKTFGGTALSNPMKALAGIEPMLLKAVPVVGGWRVSGSLPWVSHISPGQYCAAIATVREGHEMMFLLPLDERAKLRPCPKFSGMEGTGTWGITLDDFFVPHEDVIADPARPFIKRIRAAFILLQAGMATGITLGAINDIRAVEGHLGHVNRFLHDGADELEAELDDLRTRALKLAQTPFEASDDYLMNVLDVRAEGGELVLRAAQSALLHQGARGYLMSSAPQRRIRESHFVAIVTPAIKHLRWEMARLEREVMPLAENAA